jgi:hypothetical protein
VQPFIVLYVTNFIQHKIKTVNRLLYWQSTYQIYFAPNDLSMQAQKMGLHTELTTSNGVWTMSKKLMNRQCPSRTTYILDEREEIKVNTTMNNAWYNKYLHFKPHSQILKKCAV